MNQKKIGIVASRFNEPITKMLLEGALEDLHGHSVNTYWVPGAFEIPLVAKKLAETKQYDAIICLGAVIRGETPHFDFVAAEAASGIAESALATGVPIIFGVLTTNTITQAIERADMRCENKGGYAAKAAIEMSNLLDQISLAVL